MTNHPNRSKQSYPYRVVGDTSRITYSRHHTESALARKWGWSHPGTEPVVQRDTPTGWQDITGYITHDRTW